MQGHEQDHMRVVYSAPSFAEQLTMSIYIKAKSKADLNKRLDAGDSLLVTDYKPDGSTELRSLRCLPHGTVVRLRRSSVRAPFAYAKWDAIKQRVK